MSHPYITASVNLGPDPLQDHGGHKVVKSHCNNIFCANDKLKYNHEFFLFYDENSSRWSKTLQAIKNGNTKVYISGLYMGYYSKNNNDDIYHAIQLMEFDFDFNSPRSSIFSNANYNNNDDDDDDEKYFGTPKKGSSSKKRDLSLPSEHSSDSSSNIQNKKQKKKTKNKAHKMDEPVRVKNKISYDQLPVLNDDQIIYPHHSSKDKRTVQFDLSLSNENSEIDESNMAESSDNTRKKRGSRSKGNQPTRKSPRNKEGILGIAVNKIIEIDDDDDMQQKSDSQMDTESDYHQNDDDVDEDD